MVGSYCFDSEFLPPRDSRFSDGGSYPESLNRETRLEAFLVDLALGPDKWASVLIIAADEAGDMRLEFVDGLEGCSVQRLSAEDREPDLDLIEPRRVGRRVVEVHIAMARQPEIALWFVGRKVVEDHMDIPLRVVGDNLVHEVEELNASTSFVVTAGYLARDNVQRGEQRCRPIVVRPTGQRAAGGQLQSRLAVQR